MSSSPIVFKYGQHTRNRRPSIRWKPISRAALPIRLGLTTRRRKPCVSTFPLRGPGTSFRARTILFRRIIMISPLPPRIPDILNCDSVRSRGPVVACPMFRAGLCQNSTIMAHVMYTAFKRTECGRVHRCSLACSATIWCCSGRYSRLAQSRACGID
jgi:hypothetical protein